MLTVKHVCESMETIVTASDVEFKPSGGPNDPCAQLTAYNVRSGPGQTFNCYVGGLVYIMNDAGSTVGRYDLGDNRPTLTSAL